MLTRKRSRRGFISRAYARAHRPNLPSPKVPGHKAKPTIAVVTVAGNIVSDRGGLRVLPLSADTSGGDTITAGLREAVADEDVAAVVLRVDSPVGSIAGSETSWREVARIRAEGKTIVASMGAVAASGGYYVSIGTGAIVANPGTITGSIGVVGGKLVAPF